MRRVLLPVGELTAAQLAGTDPLVGGSGCCTWLSLREATGSAAARVELADRGTGQGQVLADIDIAAGASVQQYIGLHCLSWVGALHLYVVSGSITGTLLAYVDHECEHYLAVEHLAAKVLDAAALAALASTAG